jgi:hypothetical protein
MVYFQTNLGKFWGVLQRKMLNSFVAIRYILRPLGIFDGHLLHVFVIWYIFPCFGMLYQKNLATLQTRVSIWACEKRPKM